MAKKMTKQVKTMVESVNQYFKNNHIKEGGNEFFAVTCWMLIQADCYHGFNLFTADGRLAVNNEEVDHLELYIV